MSVVRKATVGLAAFLIAGTLTVSGGLAQEGPGGAINPRRDCQTITTCQFQKGGSYRGCISSYSCRVCRFVRAGCAIGSGRKPCYESRCTWG